MTADTELQEILDKVASMDVVRLPMSDGTALVVRFHEGVIEMHLITDTTCEESAVTCRLQARGAVTVGRILASFGERMQVLNESEGRVLN